MKRPYLRAFWASLVAAAALLFAVSAEAATPRVLAVEFDNDVNPVTADYVIDQIERANEGDYDAVVILLDTPGGLADAMKDIYQAELASEVPVIAYVSPDGARAASAGVWIVEAADIAAMAPSTNLGSVDPGRSRRRRDPERPASQGDQRRGEVAARARRDTRPQRRLGGGARCARPPT